MMETSINFQNYLIQNEQWLAVGSEVPGEHETNGELSNDEIKAFFSNSHIDLNNETTRYGAKISQKDFNDWYAANEEALSSYYESIGLGTDAYGSKEYRDAMRDSMLEYTENLDKYEIWGELSPAFYELEAEQLGLVDKDGVIGMRDYTRDGSLVPPITLETLNEICNFTDTITRGIMTSPTIVSYERDLEHMIEAAKNGDEQEVSKNRSLLLFSYVK